MAGKTFTSGKLMFKFCRPYRSKEMLPRSLKSVLFNKSIRMTCCFRASITDSLSYNCDNNQMLRYFSSSQTRSEQANGDVKRPVITLFSKDECPLCDVAKEALEKYKDQCEIEIIDIGEQTNLDWFEKYRYDIPVLHLNGKFLMKHKVFKSALEDAIKNTTRNAMLSRSISTSTSSDQMKYDTRKREEKDTTDLALNFFSGHYIDRCAHFRKNKELLAEKMQKPSSRYVIFKNLDPLLLKHGRRFGLRTLDFKELSETIGNPLFLDEILYLGSDSCEADWFAINLQSDLKDSVIIDHIEKEAGFNSAFAGMLKLNEMESSIAAQARGVLAWHNSHKFCPACGSKSAMKDGGYRRECSNESCSTREGYYHHSCYPRVDPVTMVLLMSPDRQSILLGRKPIFPPNFFTCLAGFMEPGESFETTVQREIYEECGLPVENIRYQLSQCWPFPSSVMFGCSATAKHTNIVMDTEELEELNWFTKEEAASLISKETFKAFKAGENVKVAPMKHALAHHLIKRWVDGYA